jgi:hypothetical protein
MASGAPETSSRTAPQKHCPVWVMVPLLYPLIPAKAGTQIKDLDA